MFHLLFRWYIRKQEWHQYLTHTRTNFKNSVTFFFRWICKHNTYLNGSFSVVVFFFFLCIILFRLNFEPSFFFLLLQIFFPFMTKRNLFDGSVLIYPVTMNIYGKWINYFILSVDLLIALCSLLAWMKMNKKNSSNRFNHYSILLIYITQTSYSRIINFSLKNWRFFYRYFVRHYDIGCNNNQQ